MRPQFQFRGIVERFIGRQVNVRLFARNGRHWRRFSSAYGYRRNLDWARAARLLVTVSQDRLVSRCQPGDQVEYDVELRPRADGLIAWGLDLRVV